MSRIIALRPTRILRIRASRAAHMANHRFKANRKRK